MHVEIDQNTREAIHSLMEKRGFDNPAHVVQYAIHQLEGQEEPMAGWDKEELRAEIQKGLDDIEAGRVRDAEEVFDELEASIEAKINAQSN